MTLVEEKQTEESHIEKPSVDSEPQPPKVIVPALAETFSPQVAAIYQCFSLLGDPTTEQASAMLTAMSDHLRETAGTSKLVQRLFNRCGNHKEELGEKVID